MAAQITVSIVSHRQQALIAPLLRQLEQHCAAVVKKVILTINLPEPDVLASMAWSFPLEKVHNHKPRGFGANHNAAFARCATGWFLVLNPDMRISSDVLSAMVGNAQPMDGVIAPRIFEPGKDTPEPHRALITPLEILLRHRTGYRPPAKPAWIPGMMMLFRSRAFREVEGFDRRYFMYGEDFDICARMKLAGWECRSIENLNAQHEAQRASHRKMRHLLWHLSSLLKIWFSTAFWRYRAVCRAPA